MPERPTGKWWSDCIEGVSRGKGAYDPARVCGAVWARKTSRQKLAVFKRDERAGRLNAVKDAYRETNSKVIKGIANAFYDSYFEKEKKLFDHSITINESMAMARKFTKKIVKMNKLHSIADAYRSTVTYFDGPESFGYEIGLKSLGHPMLEGIDIKIPSAYE